MKPSTHVFKKLSSKFRTPYQVQKLLRSLSYNREKNGDTLRSALAAWYKKEAHCLEAAFLAAAILEHRGYAPLVMSLESSDKLDHVIFVFKGPQGWGSIGRSRMEGLHGREPRFRTLRNLAYSYFDAFVDATGRITGYGVVNLDALNLTARAADWRSSPHNLWSLEKALINLKHKSLHGSNIRYLKAFRHYEATGKSGWPQPFWW